ncbi:TonB-dependent receptor plug domain-containing protein [Flagellimonas myxillae]|uniref:TonB-dependent receptor plug domain-containing protein n=1 Tax=Flagellimonas myxillae TaxID=2942214 RepID=UPI00201F3202|nr:TonB-dependent receptor plug domain-containing protein [Muricauda myxillae]MCL6266124.1 TonB-dependent receptor plug domain-containing protein [Muricauda myxillae]
MNLRHIFVAVLCFCSSLGITAQEQKKVTICWDVSHSMQHRDLDKEFYFLDTYFKTIQNAEVKVLSFSNTLISQNQFSVRNSDWAEIKKKLKDFNYDGATSYESLDSYVEEGVVLMFTDGIQNAGAATPNFGGEVFIVNSKTDFDRASLNLLTIINNGNLINLAEKETVGIAGDDPGEYSGTVYYGERGMPAIDVFVKEDPTNKVKTDDQGGFKINAAKGSTLVITIGTSIKELVLGEEKNLQFAFDDGGIQLKEVVVTEEVNEAPEEIITAYGKENKDKVGYAVQSIDSENIPDAATTGNRAIQGKFSGVSLGQNEDLSQTKMRPSNSILGNNYSLIVIDGVPTERSNSATGKVAGTSFIDPRNIAEITVLKGLAATNRYGSMGANGVLLITTKTATVDGPRGEKKDLARLTNNVYDGKLKVNNKALVTPYLKELKKGKNVQEAYDIYLTQRKRYEDYPEYLVDVASFFYASNPDLGNRILSNSLEKETASYEELRGLYLKAVESGNHKLALLGANKLAEDFPNKIQSYLDVATANSRAGNFQLASHLYAGILDGSANPELNFLSLEKLVGADLRNLANQQRAQLDLAKVPAGYRNNLTYNARLVLEWSNPDTEFVVQFVNPQKRFFNWEHTIGSDRKRIRDEIQHGFSSEQFEIVGPETVGDWILNVTYLGNRTSGNKIPTFLTCTVQYNFGKSNQSSEEFLVRLQEHGEEQQLAKFSVD